MTDPGGDDWCCVEALREPLAAFCEIIGVELDPVGGWEYRGEVQRWVLAYS